MNRSSRKTFLVMLLAGLLAALAIFVGGLLANPASASSPQQQGGPPGPTPGRVAQLQAAARGQVELSTRPATGMADFVRVARGGDLLPEAALRANPRGKAGGFLARFGGLFGVQDPAAELVEQAAAADAYGGTHFTYQQMYQGVPVFGALLRTHLDAAGQLTAVNGVFVPNLQLDTTPRLSAAQAAARAIADVLANPPKDDSDALLALQASDIRLAANDLFVYQDGLIQNLPGPALLVYQVELRSGAALREFVFVSAHTGKIVNRYSGIHPALFRRLFEQNTSTQVWQEGDPFPGSLNIDQQNIVRFSGDSYYFFFNAFGRDSYDDAGHELQSVNNDPTIACPNANWNGATTNYCNGVTADDIVAHEWGHAYTEYTHDLIYQWQPGALNESYSDIWGELVDQLNLFGTDSPGGVRTAGVCSAFTTPLPVFTINSPESIAGDYPAAGAAFGPPLTPTGITGDVVLGIDGTGPTSDACEPLVNGAAVAGNLALVDRGTCAFTIKVKNAQLAGAIGVVVANNVSGAPAPMGGADATITIPSVMVSLDTGSLLKANLPGVNATLRLGSGATENSYRWLMGEDSTAFGGAIRDMWQPTCMGDPAKVSDAQYHCATSDAGGVHTNSGVPNHGFSLLVDGGTYNGQTVAAIGPVKAAHLYFRAQSVYQTPTSDFNDHADALTASCSDLIGVPLEGLSTTTAPAGPSGQSISAGDCAAVSAMIEAVELRVDPTAQCNFQPLLAQDAPAFCADTASTPAGIFNEGFESGLGSWALANQGVFSGWVPTNWAQASSLPGGRPGAAAFGLNSPFGNCDGGAGDRSGVMTMTSPEIIVPNNPLFSPRLAFDHYVATEFAWDGGNLKISVNGGPFTLVPASAFTFNAYNLTLQTAAAGNTNPLAGQFAFSGTDGGQVTGTWGQSQLNLASLGVVPGDSIRLRYDFGQDGCTGIDGWYVDDVNVYACPLAAAPDCSTASASPHQINQRNHKLVPVSVVGVTSPNGGTPAITITGIFQDEPVMSPESGDTSPDGFGVGTSQARVRAERIGTANGRVYHIFFTASDRLGGACRGEVTVGVPVSPGSGPAIDDGALYDSTLP